MRKHDFSYFFGEGMRNMFSHGFMSFAAVGITVACLVVMGTFSLVAYNAQVQLQQLESEYEILAFVDESCDDAQTKAVGRAIEQRDNVKECVFISKEEAMKSFEARYEGDNMFQNLDPEILRDRYAVYVDDLSISGKTAQDILDNVEGVANVRVDEDIAGGFITLLPAGQEIAERIYERHRLLTKWLTGLGVDPAIASEDACRIEHVISAESFAAIKAHVRKHDAE